MTLFEIEPDVVGEWGDHMDYDAHRNPQLVVMPSQVVQPGEGWKATEC